MKKLKSLSILCLMLMHSIFLSAECHHTSSGKVYIDVDAFSASTEGDEFYIHMGNNIWLTTHTIHRDATGMFAYENNLVKRSSLKGMDYDKKWKCPYCYQYWPIGKPCGNPECPSTYK